MLASVFNMWLSLLPGAAHGGTTALLGHPLDTAKTRMQAAGPCASRSVWATVAHIAEEEGWQSLYRGVTIPLLFTGTKRAVQLSLWDRLCHYGRTEDEYKGQNPLSTNSSLYSTAPGVADWVSWMGNNPFTVGAAAGAMGTLIGCPMHVIKLRTQFLTRHDTQNAWTCASQIWREEGIMGYYRGFGVQVVKDAFFAGLYLGSYDVCLRLLRGEVPVAVRRRAAEAAVVVGPSDLFSGMCGTFVAGSVASIVTWTALYPLDTVKTIIQARRTDGGGTARFLRGQPVTGLYRGLSASLIRAVVTSGIAMMVYEVVKVRTVKYMI